MDSPLVRLSVISKWVQGSPTSPLSVFHSKSLWPLTSAAAHSDILFSSRCLLSAVIIFLYLSTSEANRLKVQILLSSWEKPFTLNCSSLCLYGILPDLLSHNALLCFTLLCFALLCLAFCFHLFCFVLLCFTFRFTLLCFALFCFTFCFTLLCFALPFFCFTLFSFALFWLFLLCLFCFVWQALVCSAIRWRILKNSLSHNGCKGFYMTFHKLSCFKRRFLNFLLLHVSCGRLSSPSGPSNCWPLQSQEAAGIHEECDVYWHRHTGRTDVHTILH